MAATAEYPAKAVREPAEMVGMALLRPRKPPPTAMTSFLENRSPAVHKPPVAMVEMPELEPD
jgi:hypothetical protein